MTQKSFKFNQVDEKVLQEMKAKSKEAASVITQKIGENLKKMYNEKLKEVKEQLKPSFNPYSMDSGHRNDENRRSMKKPAMNQYGDISGITLASPINGPPSLDSSLGRDINDLLTGTGASGKKHSLRNLQL